MKYLRFDLIIALTTLLALTACGIKPNDVDPPSADKAPTFPREYPTSK